MFDFLVECGAIFLLAHNLRLVEGVRVTNKNGDRTSQKKLILSIGPLSKKKENNLAYKWDFLWMMMGFQ